ncbi:MAG: NAD(P)H-dependent oxidoreductase [Porticoccaceae bacterium]|jgi:NAD(P)H-dependent FMN reductase|nr:NAD(P)H-dependent oxidoreductase [Porticoccaceae bacterium]
MRFTRYAFYQPMEEILLMEWGAPMKILAFAASNSSVSINKKQVTYAVGLLNGVESEVLDLNDYEMPLFSQDREHHLGSPRQAVDFMAKIATADALITSFAEHNRSYSAAYKNLFDWCSRIQQNVFQDKPIVYISTSPAPVARVLC